jgi:hypothetical protein
MSFASVKAAPFSSIPVLMSGVFFGGVLWLLKEIGDIKRAFAIPDPYTPFSRWASLITWNIWDLALWMLLGGCFCMCLWCAYTRLFSHLLARPLRQAARAHAFAFLPLLIPTLYLVSDTLNPRRLIGISLVITVAVHAGIWLWTLWRHNSLERFSARGRHILLFVTGCSVYTLLNAFVLVQGAVGPDGDEPHYLLISHSMWHDGDIDLSNNFLQRDYWPFYPRELPQRSITTGDGHVYSPHGIGLPILILPAYVVGGYAGVVLLMSVLAALLALQLYQFVAYVTQDDRTACRTWILLGFSAPLLIYSSQIYPELPAGLISLIVLRHTLHFERVGWFKSILLGMLVGALPWLNARHFILLGALGICFGYHIWRTKQYKLSVMYAIPVVCSVCGFLVYNDSIYQTATPLGGYITEGGVASHLDFVTQYFDIRGILGIWIDRNCGLLSVSPVYLLALFGVPIALRAYSRPFVWVLLIIGLTWISIGFYWGWTGGHAPPPRFLVSVIALLGLPLAAYLQQESNRLQRMLLTGLAAMSYTIVMILEIFPYTRINMWRQPNRVFLIVQEYTGIDVGVLYPIFFDMDLLTAQKAGLMLVALGGLFFLQRNRGVRRYQGSRQG